MKTYELYRGKKLHIAEKIQQRRLQMLVHSYIYYELNENIISDSKWDEWARELVELQKKYPNMSKKIMYAKEFEDWDASTGAFLQFDKATKVRALRLLRYTKQSIKTAKKKRGGRNKLF